MQDAEGGGATLNVNLSPDGTVDGTSLIENVGVVVLGGRWAYDPASQLYALDLVGNGVALGRDAFQVTQVLADGFMGTGTDGRTYRFTRR